MKKKLAMMLLLALIWALPASAAKSSPVLVASLPQDEYCSAGEYGVVRIHIKNMSASQEAYSLLFTLNGDPDTIIPTGDSGVYLEELPRGGETDIEFSVFIRANVPAGYIPVNITAAYETRSGGETSAQMTVYLPVRQDIRLETGGAVLPQFITEGSAGSCAVECMNLGKTEVYNVSMTLELKGLAEGVTSLIGNIPSGESRTGRITANAYAPDGVYGEQTGNVTITWEDEAGIVYSKTLPVSTVIREKVEQTAAETDGDEADRPVWLLSAAAAAGGLTFGCITVYTVMRARQRKRDEKLL